MTTPETVLEEAQIQMTLRQAPERAPLRLKYRPLALDGVEADALFADISLAMSDLAVILDFAQQSVTAPGVGVYCNGVRYMGKGRRQQTLVSCGVPFASNVRGTVTALGVAGLGARLPFGRRAYRWLGIQVAAVAIRRGITFCSIWLAGDPRGCGTLLEGGAVETSSALAKMS